ncbi:hypothetical protein [Allorhizobium undicola]|uniref:hypothetical protein n=1 Tax=Allorhizobium undicola TaxID=78527 RepID=UPI0004804393|nr:hypothetical protein [Allorhizobium undicola]
MKTITGTILETSPYNLDESGFTDIHEVRIQGDDGTIYVIPKLGVCTRLSNAIVPGTHGTFTIYKTIFPRRVLMAANVAGKTELCNALTTKTFLQGLAIALAGIPLLPFFGFGLFFIVLGCSAMNRVRKFNKLKSSLISVGAPIQKFQVV